MDFVHVFSSYHDCDTPRSIKYVIAKIILGGPLDL